MFTLWSFLAIFALTPNYSQTKAVPVAPSVEAAQEPSPGPSGGGGGGGNATRRPPRVTELLLINRAALASYAVQSVDYIEITVRPRSDISGDIQPVRIPYTATVPTFAGMMQLVDGRSFEFRVLYPEDPVEITVALKRYRTGTSWSWEDDTLFFGSRAARPVWKAKDGTGKWVLSGEENPIIMRLNHSAVVELGDDEEGIFITSAVHIAEDAWGNRYPYRLGITSDRRGFYFPANAVGNGTLVLQLTDGERVEEGAISLVDGRSVEIKDILVVLLTESDHVLTFTDATAIAVTVPTWSGYGVNPLIEATYTAEMNTVPVTVGTSEGVYATGFTVENLETGERGFFPAGEKVSEGIELDFPKGKFHIIPHLAVRSPSEGKG